MSEWKELDLDNIPKDILIGVAEFGIEYSNSMDIWVHSRLSTAIIAMGLGKLLYRKIKPKQPTHEEIMTKWWNLSGLWVKVISYEPREPIPYSVNKYDYNVNSAFFKDMESADIPPEDDS